MRHNNISIFIPHAGCEYQCAFCNQKIITEQNNLPHSADIKKICQQAMLEIPDKSKIHTEIAFFGGSFTAIKKSYMLELLESAQEFIGENKFSGIRISTRPDCINSEILELLKNYHVTSIELGAQSMSDKVLFANQRGHTAQDIISASKLIQEYKFELGLQMMIGLYQSTWQDELETVDKIIKIKPDTVRIYPVVILKNTKLAEIYQAGNYRQESLDNIIEMTASYMQKFMKHHIKIIKVGLHASEFVEADKIAGYYHPAFRELCESRIYRNQIEKILKNLEYMKYQQLIFAVNGKCVSKAIGQKKSNLNYFKNKFFLNIKIKTDENLGLFEVKLLEE
ncbi:MAG: radical SAM protein [Oscillospiraceae bacterium]|nr:radical SAM protein [Oscillospiraceae bacterium]